jgi:hypothetical protein
LTSVVFFYCKHQDDQRNTFLAVARAILAQLLYQNHDLLPYMYDQFLSSGQASLVSPRLCDELLKTALATMSNTYLIIDGIDECALIERRAIVSIFTSIIEADATPGRLRGMFVSQDENDIKKLLRTASVVRLNESDNAVDIESYSNHWSHKIQEKFELSPNEQRYIVAEVCRRAQGESDFLTHLVDKVPNVRKECSCSPN